jgi:hypothetical protein
MWAANIIVDFYIFKTLTYRPFLLIDGLIRKQERLHAEQGLTSPPHSEERAFLPEACRRAVDAGRGLLLLLARSYSSNPMLAVRTYFQLFIAVDLMFIVENEV